MAYICISDAILLVNTLAEIHIILCTVLISFPYLIQGRLLQADLCLPQARPEETECSSFMSPHVAAAAANRHVIPFSSDSVIPTSSSVLVLNTSGKASSTAKGASVGSTPAQPPPGDVADPGDGVALAKKDEGLALQEEGRGVGERSSSASSPKMVALPKGNAVAPNYFKDVAFFPPTDPELCSLAPSIYDNAPPNAASAAPTPAPTRRTSGRPSPTSSSSSIDDQVSLCSNRSSSSARVYSKGYVRPLPARSARLEASKYELTSQSLPPVLAGQQEGHSKQPNSQQQQQSSYPHPHRQHQDQHERLQQQGKHDPTVYTNLNPLVLYNQEDPTNSSQIPCSSFSFSTGMKYF